MKQLLLLFCILFSVEFFAQEKDTSLNKIYWNDWYKLEWSDFQAEPDPSRKVAALSSFALPYNIVSDGEGEMSVTLSVCFNKDRSWSKEEQQNDVLLQHEQLHFDIAELHRRKILKAISEAEFSKENYEAVLEEIINENWVISYREMQDKYDGETNYARIFRPQIKWNKYISQQLRNLEEFSFNKIKVSLY